MTNYTFELNTRTTQKNGAHPLRVKLYRSRTDYVFVGLRMYYRDVKRGRVVNCVTAAIDNARLTTTALQ